MNAAVRLHVERTADPAVLRWVVHDPAITAAGDGPRAVDGDGALAALIADGAALDVSVRHGDVLVRVADPAAWPRLAPAVHAAIAADLAARAAWLTSHAPTVTPVAVGGYVERVAPGYGLGLTQTVPRRDG